MNATTALRAIEWWGTEGDGRTMITDERRCNE
jgi:hypothetical protein